MILLLCMRRSEIDWYKSGSHIGIQSRRFDALGKTGHRISAECTEWKREHLQHDIVTEFRLRNKALSTHRGRRESRR